MSDVACFVIYSGRVADTTVHSKMLPDGLGMVLLWLWSPPPPLLLPPLPFPLVVVVGQLLSCVLFFETPWTVPARLLCLWDFAGKNTGVGCYFLLQGIFSIQGLNLCLLCWQVDSLPLSHQGSHLDQFKGLRWSMGSVGLHVPRDVAPGENHPRKHIRKSLHSWQRQDSSVHHRNKA